MKRFVLLILLLSNSVLAGEGSYFKYGIGFSNPDQHSLGEVKFGSFGYQGDALYLLDYQLEAGGWIDTHNGSGRKSNGFMSAQLGLDPQLGGFYMHSFHGIAGVARKDSTLGSNYQFVHDVGFGVGDRRGVRVGLLYKHFSNAGIVEPNHGRDFLGVRLQIPW